MIAALIMTAVIKLISDFGIVTIESFGLSNPNLILSLSMTQSMIAVILVVFILRFRP